MIKKIAITTGDKDGIGLEVTAKSLLKVKGAQKQALYLFRSKGSVLPFEKRILKKFQYKKIEGIRTLSELPKNEPGLFDIQSKESPAKWFHDVAIHGKQGQIDAVVTGPLSKQVSQDYLSGINGHTDILRSVFPNLPLYMCFLGEHFNVCLLTDHIPLSKVSSTISMSHMLNALNEVRKILTQIKPKDQKKKVALLGLNPHAGENGHLGNEEEKIHKVILKQLQNNKLVIDGPLVPDVAFQSQIRKNYSFFIANYHDQGLIPFKALHKSHSNVQTTLGLPFVRTSVDHGTAKDIFGKNKANEKSMFNAINWALRLIK